MVYFRGLIKNNMRNKLLFLLVTLTALSAFSQTTFVFSGEGNWTDSAQWENSSLPGTTIDESDTVLILGNLTISAGTTITNNGTIESSSTATGTPDIKISGSLVNNKNISFSRTQILIDVDGGIVLNGTSELDLINNSNLTNNSRFNIFGGTLTIESPVSNFINDGMFRSSGTVRVLSGNFINKSDENNPDLVSVTNNGLFEITNGNVINRGDFKIQADGVLINSKTFTNEVTGDLYNAGQIIIKDFSTSFINKGEFNNIKNITVENAATLNMAAGSNFTNQIQGAVMVSSDAKVINKADTFVIREGKITNNGTFNSDTAIRIFGDGELENNGSLINGFGADIENFGIVSGINTEHSGSFTNGSILAPGNSVDATGLYKMDSFFTSYTQTSDGSLNIDLGGTVAGESYDQVIIDRDAAIDGTLNVTLVDGFVPAAGDVFTVLLQGRNVSGAFATVNLPLLPVTMEWDVVEYDNTNGITISVKEVILGVSDNVEAPKLKVYPNPVSNELNISGLTISTNATIFSVTGRKIMDVEVSNEHSSIDLNELSSGMYLLNVSGKTLKFVKK